MGSGPSKVISRKSTAQRCSGGLTREVVEPSLERAVQLGVPGQIRKCTVRDDKNDKKIRSG